jgi:purine-binding chemotaxis protein CheW
MTRAARGMKADPIRGATPIDWDRVKQRLDAAREAVAGVPSAERRQQILHERARALAVDPQPALAAGARIEVLEFTIAGERHAIETAWVHEVHTLKALTPLPCTPAYLAGITTAHGRVLAVIDLKPLFGLPAGLDDQHKLIVLRDREMEFGLLADQVLGVEGLALADIQPAPPTVAGAQAEFLRGVTPDRRVVLDARKLLNHPSLVIDEKEMP